MENVKNSEYLYQYTSIETLALILNGKKIKFNSLQNVDDLEEMESEESETFGKFVFVSCWTKDEKENIALWNMYTPKMKGVRIMLPLNCLDYSKQYLKEQTSNFDLNLIKQHIYAGLSDIYEELIIDSNNVCYTEFEDLLKPNIIVKYKKDKNFLSMFDIGKFKSEQWKFQKEYRYILITLPKSINLNKSLDDNEVDNLIKTIDEFETIPEGIYIDIKSEALEEMKILLGPGTNNADKLIVDALIEKYNKDNNANIPFSSNSKLKIKNKN